MTPDEVRDAFEQSGAPQLAEKLDELFVPSLRIRCEPRAEEDLPLGAARFGGAPDLPPGTGWPHRDGRPLAFLAQIDLAVVGEFFEEPPENLEGWLCFYYDAEEQPWGFDPKDRAGWVVQQFRGDADTLRRTPPPESLPEASVFQPATLVFEPELSLPWPDVFEQLENCSTEEEADAYREVFEQLDLQNADEPIHRLFGWSQNIQSPMEPECQLVSNGLYCGNSSGYEDPRAEALLEDAGEWLLLLQLDTDDTPGWGWGDMGRLYFWIRRQDLLAGDFEQVWCVLQCS